MRCLLVLATLIVASQQSFTVDKGTIQKKEVMHKPSQIEVAFSLTCSLNKTFAYEMTIWEKDVWTADDFVATTSNTAHDTAEGRFAGPDKGDGSPLNSYFDNYVVLRHNCTENGQASRDIEVYLGQCDVDAVICTYMFKYFLDIESAMSFDCNEKAVCRVQFF